MFVLYLNWNIAICKIVIPPNKAWIQMYLTNLPIKWFPFSYLHFGSKRTAIIRGKPRPILAKFLPFLSAASFWNSNNDPILPNYWGKYPAEIAIKERFYQWCIVLAFLFSYYYQDTRIQDLFLMIKTCFLSEKKI